MRRSVLGGLLVAAFAIVGAETAGAQETGTPVFSAPYRAYTNYSIGGSFSDPGDFGDWALEGFYTWASGPHDISVRAGMLDFGDDTNVLLGAEFRTRVVNYSQSFPFDGALTVGAGADFGEGPEIFLIPVGVTLGRRLQLEGSRTTFTPYVHPVLVPFFGSGDVDSDVDFALGLGVDMNFGGNLSLRVNAGVGEIEGVGFSLANVQ
jgi:hypothetical protein